MSGASFGGQAVANNAFRAVRWCSRKRCPGTLAPVVRHSSVLAERTGWRRMVRSFAGATLRKSLR